MSNLQILDNAELNQKAQNEHLATYNRIINDRVNRKNLAFDDFMVAGGFTDKPKATLESLNKMLEMLNKTNTSVMISDNQAWVNSKIAEITSLISTGNYAVVDTPDYAYNQSYKSYSNNFVWPSQDELAIQETEKNELLALVTATE